MTAIDDRPTTAMPAVSSAELSHPAWCDRARCDHSHEVADHVSRPLSLVAPAAGDDVAFEARLALVLERIDARDQDLNGGPGRWHRSDVFVRLGWQDEQGRALAWPGCTPLYTPETGRRLAEAFAEATRHAEVARELPDVAPEYFGLLADHGTDAVVRLLAAAGVSGRHTAP